MVLFLRQGLMGLLLLLSGLVLGERETRLYSLWLGPCLVVAWLASGYSWAGWIITAGKLSLRLVADGNGTGQGERKVVWEVGGCGGLSVRQDAQKH